MAVDSITRSGDPIRQTRRWVSSTPVTGHCGRTRKRLHVRNALNTVSYGQSCHRLLSGYSTRMA